MNARIKPGAGMGTPHNRKPGAAKRTKRRRNRWGRRMLRRLLNG